MTVVYVLLTSTNCMRVSVARETSRAATPISFARFSSTPQITASSRLPLVSAPLGGRSRLGLCVVVGIASMWPARDVRRPVHCRSVDAILGSNSNSRSSSSCQTAVLSEQITQITQLPQLLPGKQHKSLGGPLSSRNHTTRTKEIRSTSLQAATKQPRLQSYRSRTCLCWQLDCATTCLALHPAYQLATHPSPQGL